MIREAVTKAGQVAWSLRNRREVREAATYFDVIPDKKPDAAMIQIAQKIIAQKQGPARKKAG